MKFSKFLRASTAAALTLGLLTSTPALAETFRLTHQWKEGTDGRDRAARLFVEEVVKRDPSFKIRIFPNRSLIADPTQQLSALRDGTIEMSVFPLIYGSGIVPEFSGTILPGAVNGVEHAKTLKNSEFHKVLQDVAEKNGVHVLTWWWTEGGFASRDKPVLGPDSVKGMKLRGSDKSIDVLLSAAGASVFSMPSTELYSAMQTGVLDGLMTSYESLTSMRLYEQVQHATLAGGYSIFNVIQPLVISKTAWDSLTPEQQAIFEEAAAITEEVFYNEQLKTGDEIVATFKNAGVEVRSMTEEEHAEWLALAQKTSWVEFAKISADAQAMVDALRAE